MSAYEPTFAERESRWAIWCPEHTPIRESKLIGITGKRQCPRCGKWNTPDEGFVQLKSRHSL